MIGMSFVATPTIANENDGTVRTEDLHFDNKALALHVAQMVDGGDDLPFMKWEAPGAVPLKYFILGVKEPYLSVFHRVITSFGERLGMPIERSATTTGSQMLFFYFNELSDMLRIPNLAVFFGGKESQQQAQFKELLTGKRPVQISGYGANINDTNTMVPSYFRLARALKSLTQPNEFVQAFAMDAYAAFTLRGQEIDAVPSSLYAHLNNIPGLTPPGEPYAWRIPPIDLLYLDALYQPDVLSGMPHHEAATQIHKIIREDLAASRVLSPVSRFSP